MAASHTIFVVDDQDAILNAVKSILQDESYRILTFSSAETLQEGLRLEQPDLVLLDIWLPGIDGLAALADLKKHYPTIPVILMSGHAGIEVAVRAMKSGAADFLEKPLNIDSLLSKIAFHISGSKKSSETTKPSHSHLTSATSAGHAASVQQSSRKQKTLQKNAVMNGVGLLTGRPTGIIISPLPEDSGIIFRTLDGVEIPGHITALEDFDRISSGGKFTANSTVLARGGRRIRTVEHLLGALHMLGITNATVKVDEEIPNIDGSAEDFCRIIAAAGVQEQSRNALEVVIHQKIAIGNEDIKQKYLYVEPYDGFAVDVRVDFPAPIFEERFYFDPYNQDFTKEIAPARSFNTFENIDMAQKAGMVGSGYLNSHIIIHDGKVINTDLRFPDEFVRHKILDLLGDIYLIGFGLRGRIVANMPSHGLNQALALQIYKSL